MNLYAVWQSSSLTISTEVGDSVYLWWDNVAARVEILGNPVVEQAPTSHSRIFRATASYIRINFYGDDPRSTIIAAVARNTE